MAYLEIKLNEIDNNIDVIKKLIPNNCGIIAVVKANAYGLGAIGISSYLDMNSNVTYLAVGRLEEGIELRENGINKPIIVFANLNPDDLDLYLKYNLEPTISDNQNCDYLINEFSKSNNTFNIHIKINTGMNRLGINQNDFFEKFEKIKDLGNVNVKTIYSHFANADEKNHPLNRIQAERFQKIYNDLKPENHDILFHMANSGAILNFPDQSYDLVRSGVLIYGHLPNPNIENIFGLKSIFDLKAKVLQIMEIKMGDKVGYGSSFVADKTTTIASIAIGYADGYSRKLSNNSFVLFNNKVLKTIGNVSMDQISILIPKDLSIKKGDVVKVYSNDSKKTSLASIAIQLETLQYELLTTLSARVKRVYKT